RAQRVLAPRSRGDGARRGERSHACGARAPAARRAGRRQRPRDHRRDRRRQPALPHPRRSSRVRPRPRGPPGPRRTGRRRPAGPSRLPERSACSLTPLPTAPAATLPPPAATCTWATSAPRSSPGCWPAAAGAPSTCGSRISTGCARARHRARSRTWPRSGSTAPASWSARREILEAPSAPHAPPGAYPGTCRDLSPADREQGRRRMRELRREPALRLRAGVDSWQVHDLWAGEVTAAVDDLVLRRGDGVVAYNLAVVVDDAAAGVDQVVRADDLLSSAPRQAYLAHLLELP